MLYSDLIGKDITVYSEFGSNYRGILRSVINDPGILEFEVGIDIFYIRVDAVYAVTEHGIS
jgi:hypothetical protein